MKISIIGTGIYGLALAFNMPEYNIEMWSESENLVQEFQKTKKLPTIIDKEIPSNINITTSLDIIENSDLIIIATSIKYVSKMCRDMKKYYHHKTPICLASKGFAETGQFLSDTIKNTLNTKNIAILSGPTFAIDLINKEPCSLTLASTSKKAIQTIMQALNNNNLKLKITNDVYGAQICGGIKNIIAISSGILNGLGYNESTKAFLLTESIHDIQELLKKLNCNSKTILSYAGIGDLILTSTSKSRNYSYGVLLGKSTSPEIIQKYLENNTTEGYLTLLALKKLVKNKRIKIPLINVIYDIAINNKDPQILINYLLTK